MWYERCDRINWSQHEQVNRPLQDLCRWWASLSSCCAKFCSAKKAFFSNAPLPCDGCVTVIFFKFEHFFSNVAEPTALMLWQMEYCNSYLICREVLVKLATLVNALNIWDILRFVTHMWCSLLLLTVIMSIIVSSYWFRASRVLQQQFPCWHLFCGGWSYSHLFYLFTSDLLSCFQNPVLGVRVAACTPP